MATTPTRSPLNSALPHISPAGTVTEPRSSSHSRPSAVESLLAERRHKLDIDKSKKDEAEEQERKAKANARKADLSSDTTSAKAKQATYAQQQRQRQQEAKLERERILQQIERDRTERRQKEEQRKASASVRAKGKVNDNDQEAARDYAKSLHLAEPMTNRNWNFMRERYCIIQVRLFEGSKIRQRFALDQTLRSGVRPWVEEQRSNDEPPFMFKQILNPSSNRALSISEEEESLQDLGFAPSATLVMVPIQGYTAAYSGGQGVLSRGASVGYSAVCTGAGMITEAIGSFLGYGPGQPRPNAAEPTTSASKEQVSKGANVRTLRARQDSHDDHQLYNGNQVNISLDLCI